MRVMITTTSACKGEVEQRDRRRTLQPLPIMMMGRASKPQPVSSTTDVRCGSWAGVCKSLCSKRSLETIVANEPAEADLSSLTSLWPR